MVLYDHLFIVLQDYEYSRTKMSKMRTTQLNAKIYYQLPREVVAHKNRRIGGPFRVEVLKHLL